MEAVFLQKYQEGHTWMHHPMATRTSQQAEGTSPGEAGEAGQAAGVHVENEFKAGLVSSDVSLQILPRDS